MNNSNSNIIQRKRKSCAIQGEQVAAVGDQSAHRVTPVVTQTEIEKKRAISRRSSQRHRLKEKFLLEEFQRKKDDLTETNEKLKAENVVLRENVRAAKLMKMSKTPQVELQ